MKYFTLIVWMFCSLLLVLSVIGLLLFIRTDAATMYYHGEDGKSTWSTIGMKLLDHCING